jgi:hypothetical protein
MDPDEVRRLFARLLEAPGPPSSANVLTAVTRGRRTVRRRRLAATGLSGTMALAVVAGGMAIAGTGDRPPVGTVVPPATTSATSTPMPARFDPRFVQARLGWIPPGLQLFAVSASELSYYTSYRYKPAPGENAGDSTVRLELELPGYEESSSRPRREWPTTPAPPVNGHPAAWVHAPQADAQTAILRWSYAAGSSATVTVIGLRGGLDARQSARRVAERVRIATGEPITTPFHLARVPAGMPLSSISVKIQDDNAMPWEAGLTFTGGGESVNVHVFPKPDCVCGHKFDTDQNATINGTPAWVADRSVTLYFGRVIAEVNLTPDHNPSGHPGNDRPNEGAPSPDLVDLAAALTVYPDRADWRPPLENR